ncbi:atypical/ABC1/ABC1-B protein kinase [Melampsora americana]|nr:atypical/ABC1/ABC1-B protein kinase [Melampsora americana]
MAALPTRLAYSLILTTQPCASRILSFPKMVAAQRKFGTHQSSSLGDMLRIRYHGDQRSTRKLSDKNSLTPSTLMDHRSIFSRTFSCLSRTNHHLTSLYISRSLSTGRQPSTTVSRPSFQVMNLIPPRLDHLGRQIQRTFITSKTLRKSYGQSAWNVALVRILLVILVSSLLYMVVPPFRYIVIGVVRCARVALAVSGAILDYKALFSKTWTDDETGRTQRHLDYQSTHLSAAKRILEVLKRNGGIYVKLGQHLSSIQLIPLAWSQTMRPLQDQCLATPCNLIDKLFLEDVGAGIRDLFEEFDPAPIGVASLAQVHRAKDRQTGREVAVKVMHPTLEEYLAVDMQTVIVMLRFVKWVFPEFEFTWLGEEMKENLPKEMDFRIEVANALRCSNDFSSLKSTTLKIPDVLWAKRRVLVMEYIHGGRFDDLEYLADHSIDRNKASQELTRIFSQMLYLNGYFHGDPHAGNLLIRPASATSRSPYNFEIVLLDHGLYFDLSDQLRVDYAHFWLSLLKSDATAERRKYAKLVGNIDDDHYNIFESAITGRVGMKGTGSLMVMNNQTREEQQHIRSTVVAEEGMISNIFQILRKVPRRLLMILKVNDLTRSLDVSLNTTHPPVRIWLIVARFCELAIWKEEVRQMRLEHRLRGLSLNLATRWFQSLWEYQKWYNALRVVEWSMDLVAGLKKSWLWLKGLREGGLDGARREAAGLLIT